LIWHLEIQQNHVRRILLNPLKSFASGPRLCADLPCASLLEKSPKIVPDCRVVVYNEYSNQTALPGAQSPKVRFSLTPKIFGLGRGNSLLLASRSQHSMSFAVTCCFVRLHHCPRGHFLGAVAVASGPLRTLLDMLILPLLFCAHTAKMFLSWHQSLFHSIFCLSGK
jgi:hypothetical protein